MPCSAQQQSNYPKDSERRSTKRKVWKRTQETSGDFLATSCGVPGHKLQLGLLKVGLATLDGRQAVQAQMGPLMIVIPQELVQDPHAGLGRARPIDRETFVVQSAKESLHFSVRLRMPWSRPPVCDAQAPAGLLEASLPLRMKRITHGEDQVVVGHHRFDP